MNSVIADSFKAAMAQDAIVVVPWPQASGFKVVSGTDYRTKALNLAFAHYLDSEIEMYCDARGLT